MFELFKILGTVAVDNSDANQALGETEEQATQTSKSIGERMQDGLGKAEKAVGNVGKGMTKWVTGPIAGVTTGMFGLVNSAANYADELYDMSHQTGISAEGLQELHYWSDQNGLSQSSLYRATGRLNQRIGLAADGNEKYAGAFETLGVSIQDTNGDMRSSEDIFAESIKSLSEIEDGSTRSAMASELFGTKLARELLPALGDGNTSIEEAAEMAREFSGFMSNEAVNDADAFAQEISNLQIEFQGLFREIAMDLIPIFRDQLFPLLTDVIFPAIGSFVESISELISWFQGLDPTVQENIVKFIALLAALGPILVVVGKVIGAIKLLVPVFAALFSPIGLVITIVGALVGAFIYLWNTNEEFRTKVIEIWESIKNFFMVTVPEIVTGIIEWFQQLPERIREFFTNIIESAREWGASFRESMSETWENIKLSVSEAIESVRETISNTWQSIKDTTSEIWNSVKEFISTTWESIKNGVSNAITSVQNTISNIWNAIKNITTNIWNGIVNFITSVWQGIQNIVNTTINTVRTIISTVLNVIRNTVTTIFNAIRNTISNVLNAARNIVSNVFNAIRNTISNVLNTVRSIVSNVLNTIKSTFSNVFNSLRSTVTTAFNNVRNAVRNGMNRAFNVVKGFFGKFKNAGRNIVTSIADGITGAIGKVTGAISNVAGKIRDFLPFSPAKEGPLMDIDKLDFGGPIEHSIEDDENKVQRALRHLLEIPDIDRDVELPIRSSDLTKGTGGHSQRAQGQSQLQQLTTRLLGKFDEFVNRPVELVVVAPDGQVLARYMSDSLDRELGNKQRLKKRGR